MTCIPPRLPPADPATYSPAQQAIHDAISSGPRGEVRGPLAIWMHRPGLAASAQELGRYCRYDTALGPRLSELAILVTARVFGSEYEWFAHKPHALNAGLPADLIEAIRMDQTPNFNTSEDSIVYEVARAVHINRNLDDALYARATEVLGTDRLVDLIGLLGYYTLISLTINVFGVSPPYDVKPELSHG
jgi:4-carboxymuconolactone decarboxylase